MFFLRVRQSFIYNVSCTETLWELYVSFFVCLLIGNAVYLRFKQIFARVEQKKYLGFTVFTIVFYDILSTLGIKFIGQWYLFRMTRMATPKEGKFNDMLHRSLHSQYIQRNINYKLLTQAILLINLIKIHPSKENIFIIIITFLSGEVQYWCRLND